MSAPARFRPHTLRIQKQLAPYAGLRVLDKVEKEPEATYDEYKAKWADMGSPEYMHPVKEGPGHIVCLTWDSAIPKFGIDRGAGVWNDYGNPDQFRLWYEFGNLAEGIGPYWKSQTLRDGLPVVTTVFDRDQVRYEVEQFAYPLNGPPPWPHRRCVHGPDAARQDDRSVRKRSQAGCDHGSRAPTDLPKMTRDWWRSDWGTCVSRGRRAS